MRKFFFCVSYKSLNRISFQHPKFSYFWNSLKNSCLSSSRGSLHLLFQHLYTPVKSEARKIFLDLFGRCFVEMRRLKIYNIRVSFFAHYDIYPRFLKSRWTIFLLCISFTFFSNVIKKSLGISFS